MDWNAQTGPKVEKLPAAIQPVAIFARRTRKRAKNLFAKMIGGEFITDYAHRSDRMATKSIVGFLDDPEFQRAYARAVAAGEWDYGIPYRVHQALWCSKQAQKVPGDYVELGTGRGFVMSAILEAYPEWSAGERSAYLFDTFEQGWVTEGGRGRVSPYYAQSVDDVIANFSEWEHVNIEVGNVYDTLPKAPIEQVAFLHVDLNAAEPEIWSIEQLWPRISPGGVILLDDFANLGRSEQHGAVLELGKKLGFEVLYTASGQGIIIR